MVKLTMSVFIRPKTRKISLRGGQGNQFWVRQLFRKNYKCKQANFIYVALLKTEAVLYRKKKTFNELKVKNFSNKQFIYIYIYIFIHSRHKL